jgi:hypothetical protein
VDDPREPGEFHPTYAAQIEAEPTTPTPFPRATYRPDPTPG